MSVVRRTTLTLTACLALAFAGGASAGKRSAPAEQPIQKPSAEEMQNQEAIKQYQFGNQYFAQGLNQQAQEALRRALQIQPTYPEASYLLANVLLQLNDFRGAIAQAETALQQNPFMTEAHTVLGTAYAKMGDFDRALREFEIVKSDISFPTPEVPEFNIGHVFWEKQACGEAVVHFRKALDINPGFWRAWYLLGDCQEQLGQREMARQSYEKGLAIEGDDVNIRYRLAVVCFQLHDNACARENFTKVRDGAPASDVAVGAREYLRQMDFK